ncbi:MAG: D-alanyl-D-alanine carboxypeptidase family protein [Oscillospiraceae bacterium]
MKKYRFLPLLLSLALLLPTGVLAVGTPSNTQAMLTAGGLEDPKPAATAAILVDADHGEVLYGKNEHEHRFPASITKVMTGLLVLEAADRGELALTDVITADASMNRDLSADGSTQDIKVGEQMTVNDLLHCLLIPSANEAANILAVAVAGNLDSFIAKMNQRATELGCENTHFSNTHGLHSDDHYTTAYDITLFVRQAMQNPTFREIVSSVSYTVPPTNMHEERILHDTNALISTFNIRGYYYKYAIGVKTGTTPQAGSCLAAAAEKDGEYLISVILGAEVIKQENGERLRQSFSETTRMFEWGFANFQRQTILDSVTPLQEIPVTLSDDVSSVAVRPETGLEATLPTDLDLTTITKEVKLFHESIEAPVKAGQVLGEVTVKNGDTTYPPIPLVAVQGVERSEMLYRIHQVKQFFSQLWVKILLVAVLLLIVVLILRFTVFKPRNRYGRRRR